MGTAILQRGLRHDATSHPTSPPTRSHKTHNPNPSPTATRRRKRTPPAAAHPASQDRDRSRRDGDRSCVVVKQPGANLVMGQVKILKRGEKLRPEPAAEKKKSEGGFDSDLGTTDRFGPDPETVKKQVRVSDLKDAMFAGPTLLVSPPPSSVPVPVFLKRKNLAVAACDLMQMLRVVN